MLDCFRTTTDPIAKALFHEDQFMLLEYGQSSRELRPGNIARRRHKHPSRVPIFDQGSRLFEPGFDENPEEHPYSRLGRSATTRQTINAAASLAKVLVGAGIPAVKINTALSRMREISLDINIAGCRRFTVSQGAAEAAFRKLALTTLGESYLNEGQSFYLVLETLQARGVYLRKSDGSDFKIDIDIDIAEWAEIGLALDKATSKGNEIHMQRTSEPIVIAFKAVQLIKDETKGFWFRGLEKSILKSRGDDEDAKRLSNIKFADLDDFSDDNSLFVKIADKEH